MGNDHMIIIIARPKTNSIITYGWIHIRIVELTDYTVCVTLSLSLSLTYDMQELLQWPKIRMFGSRTSITSEAHLSSTYYEGP